MVRGGGKWTSRMGKHISKIIYIFGQSFLLFVFFSGFSHYLGSPKSYWISFVHFVLSTTSSSFKPTLSLSCCIRPRLVPGRPTDTSNFPTWPSSLLLTCPYHFNFFFVIFFATGATFTLYQVLLIFRRSSTHASQHRHLSLCLVFRFRTCRRPIQQCWCYHCSPIHHTRGRSSRISSRTPVGWSRNQGPPIISILETFRFDDIFPSCVHSFQVAIDVGLVLVFVSIRGIFPSDNTPLHFSQFPHPALALCLISISIHPFSSHSPWYLKLFTFFISSPGSVTDCRSSISACSYLHSIQCLCDLPTLIFEMMTMMTLKMMTNTTMMMIIIIIITMMAVATTMRWWVSHTTK